MEVWGAEGVAAVGFAEAKEKTKTHDVKKMRQTSFCGAMVVLDTSISQEYQYINATVYCGLPVYLAV